MAAERAAALGLPRGDDPVSPLGNLIPHQNHLFQQRPDLQVVRHRKFVKLSILVALVFIQAQLPVKQHVVVQIDERPHEPLFLHNLPGKRTQPLAFEGIVRHDSAIAIVDRLLLFVLGAVIPLNIPS